MKTDWLINKLKLSEGFSEEKIELSIHRSTLLSIAIIVIGGVIFIDSLPHFCREAWHYLQQYSRSTSASFGWLVFYLIRVMLGYLLMAYHRVIVNFIERKRKQPVTEE
jgi:hypothetical protein